MAAWLPVSCSVQPHLLALLTCTSCLAARQVRVRLLTKAASSLTGGSYLILGSWLLSSGEAQHPKTRRFL